MSYVLRLNGEQVAISGGWAPKVFGEKTGVSFPREVPPGYTWANDDFTLAWEEDPPAPPPEPVRTITADQFRDRFTVEEMDAVLALAYGGDAIARRLLFKLQTQPAINLDSPEVVGGLQYLVSVGVLTSARVGEVAA